VTKEHNFVEAEVQETVRSGFHTALSSHILRGKNQWCNRNLRAWIVEVENQD